MTSAPGSAAGVSGEADDLDIGCAAVDLAVQLLVITGLIIQLLGLGMGAIGLRMVWAALREGGGTFWGPLVERVRADWGAAVAAV